MDIITTALGPFGLAAVVYLGAILSTLSERLNAVAKKGNYHRWFRVANGLIALAVHIPLAVGATADLVLVWYYWGWILKEKSA
jgi:hypothetical protein